MHGVGEAAEGRDGEGASQPSSLTGTHLGRYRLGAPIGAGSWGTVYEAVHVAVARKVALKVADPTVVARPELRARLLRKLHVIARLDHPHIVDFTDLGAEGDQIFLVM